MAEGCDELLTSGAIGWSQDSVNCVFNDPARSTRPTGTVSINDDDVLNIGVNSWWFQVARSSAPG